MINRPFSEINDLRIFYSRMILLVRNYVGLLDGLLGVAGMMITMNVMDYGSRKFPAFN
jgi:hypothetical protein